MQLKPEPRYRRIWLLLGWGMIFAVFVLSLIPLDVDLSEGRDKVAHFVAYGSMAFWFGMLFPGRARQFAWMLAFAAMGIAIEYLQRMTGYRTFEFADMVANGTGAALGFTLAQTPLVNALGWTEALLNRVIRRP